MGPANAGAVKATTRPSTSRARCIRTNCVTPSNMRFSKMKNQCTRSVVFPGPRSRRSALRPVSDELVRPLEEPLHIRRVCVAAVVLAPRQLAAEQSLVDRRHLRGARVALDALQSLNAKQLPDSAGIHGGHPASLVIQPLGVTL